MVTKSIELTDEEAAALRAYVEATGEGEADALQRAAKRGLEEMRLERGLRAFREGRGASEAAEIAGVPRAPFLQMLIELGETLDRGPSRLIENLEFLGQELGDERLPAVARRLTEEND